MTAASAPRLMKWECAVKPYFTCYIEGANDDWQAHCADFDISVNGRSLDETKLRLETAVRSYVGDALSEPEPARSRLLNRRSPLWTRITWRLRVAISALGPRAKPEFEGQRTFCEQACLQNDMFRVELAVAHGR